MHIRTDLIDNYLAVNQMTKTEFYTKCEINQRTFYKAMRGESIQPKTVGKIANFIGVEVSELAKKS